MNIRTVNRDGHSTRHSDRGETLIELLIAALVMSITVAALLNSLIESSSASVVHRSAASLDSVLRSFAESATYQIQMQPITSSGSGGPAYAPCALPSSYSILSGPTPSTGPSGTVVTVFATGVSSPISNVSLTNSTNPTDTATADPSSVVTDSSGDATVTFTVPSLNPGSYSVSVNEAGGGSVASSDYFTVTSGSLTTSSSSLAQYRLQMTEVDWWINSTGSFLVGSSSPATMSQCQTPGDSGIQRLTISASATDGSTSTLQFVVTDPHSEDPEITTPGGGNGPGSSNNPVNFTFRMVPARSNC